MFVIDTVCAASPSLQAREKQHSQYRNQCHYFLSATGPFTPWSLPGRGAMRWLWGGTLAAFVLMVAVAEDDVWCREMQRQRIWDRSRLPWQKDRAEPPRWNDLGSRTQLAFSRCGSVRISTSMFVDDSNGGQGTQYGYARRDIEAMIARPTADPFVTAIREHVAPGNRVVVIGSQSPRYEAVCVSLGATTLTVDYNRLVFEHPKMRTTTAEHFFAKNASTDRFDVLISASSLDHDGLGRYSDPIAPDGDLLSIDYLRSRAGLLLISVPVGPDMVDYNVMRIYGPVRLPLLLRGFKIVAAYNFDPAKINASVANFRRTYEPVFVLRPIADDSYTPPLESYTDARQELR